MANPRDDNRIPSIGTTSSVDGKTVHPATYTPIPGVDPVNVSIVDGSGSQITSFGGGTQYTDAGTPPAHPVGNTIEWSDGANWQTVSTAKPLPVTASVSVTNPTIGAAVPATANYIAANNGGNLTGLLIGQQTAANSLAVILPSATITTLTPPAAITNFANETGGNLAAIKADVDKIPSQGQALAAASLPVVLTAAQITTLTPVSAVTATLGAETTKVIGVTRTADGSGNLLTSTTNALDVNVKSGTVTSHPVTVVSGGIASGAIASGAIAAGAIAAGAVVSGAVLSGAFASGSIASGAIASGALASGSIASGAIVDGGDVALGTTTVARSTATDTTSVAVIPLLKEISYMEQNPASRAVTIAAAPVLVAGSAIIGKVTTDQTTHGTTDLVAADITKIAGGAVTATNVAITDSPLNLGVQAVSSENSAVTTARKVQLVADLVGKLIVLPYANPENFVSGRATATDTTTTSLIASPGGSLRNYITQISILNTSATTIYVKIQDGSGGTELYDIPAPAGGGATLTFPTPLRQPTTATAIYFAESATASAVFISASGYKGL
jgi:uncharacterized protein YjbI with pentapeptide repeats